MVKKKPVFVRSETSDEDFEKKYLRVVLSLYLHKLTNFCFLSLLDRCLKVPLILSSQHLRFKQVDLTLTAFGLLFILGITTNVHAFDNEQLK